MIFSALFWASFFILIGISIIIKAIFNIDLPIVQIFFATFFIYIGISMLLPKKSKVIILNQRHKEHTVVFSQQTIDLSQLSMDKEVEATIVFGKGTIIIDPTIPTKIIVQGAFSSLSMPDERHDGALMGKTVYTTKSFEPDRSYATIELVAVFSNVKIVEKR